MSVTIKYKVHDFAKDIGKKSTEMLELLNKFEEKERTHMAALSAREVDYLLNYYTGKNSVDSFDAFLESGKKPVEPKAEKPQEKSAEKPAQKKRETKPAEKAEKAESADKKPKQEKKQPTKPEK